MCKWYNYPGWNFARYVLELHSDCQIMLSLDKLSELSVWRFGTSRCGCTFHSILARSRGQLQD